jgi:predicted SAM-dependent methyltransferase
MGDHQTEIFESRAEWLREVLQMNFLKSTTRAIVRHVVPMRYRNAISSARERLWLEQREEIINRRNREMIGRLLQDQDPIRLELGAGERKMPGWLSADINGQSDLCLNLSQPIPFPDNAVAEVYSSHMLEHFQYPQPMMSLLSECRRILEPGGYFKVAVPNARIYLESYSRTQDFAPEFYCRYKPAYHYNSKIDYVNYIAYMAGDHRYMFDEENLLVILSNAGFNDVRLRDYDSLLDLEARHYETIYAEGKK